MLVYSKCTQHIPEMLVSFFISRLMRQHFVLMQHAPNSYVYCSYCDKKFKGARARSEALVVHRFCPILKTITEILRPVFRIHARQKSEVRCGPVSYTRVYRTVPVPYLWIVTQIFEDRFGTILHFYSKDYIMLNFFLGLHEFFIFIFSFCLVVLPVGE